ncbi:unnamed protein product [Kuraishia capsulata CBS 1993]|uniref:Cation-transporting ATPase n=1 Tax=Kuraishia capsulata CBS 1993 TaxID=1382522 RepID=W6MSC9_9ASCO|nr:uncharacterized protein KUCA_T00005699001 [Kuraishia capsulata CBS 1993]CDK29706.1 unnamed protein product [Kuraishia capsulata CBS 1993]
MASYSSRQPYNPRRSSSRHRESISSYGSSRPDNASNMLDDNDHEMYSGAASEVIPSSISSFHHHHHQGNYRSPRLSYSTANQLDSGLELTESGRGRNVNIDADYEETPSRSSSVETDRLNFRYFTTEEIENAQGVSTMENAENSEAPIDYDTNWNSYQDDYTDYYGRRGSLVDKATRSTQGSPNADYGSMDAASSTHLLYDTDYHSDVQSSLSGREYQPGTLKTEVKHHDEVFPSHPALLHYQRFYIAEEDLVVGIAGYSTSRKKLFAYYMVCILTAGLGYLLLRWLPRYRVKMMGNPSPLGKSDWCIVETEFGELEIIDINRQWYNQPLSTYLSKNFKDHDPEGKPTEEAVLEPFEDPEIDSDPLIPVLISFEYRYMKLYYSPVEDMFKVSSNWIDERWCDLESSKGGLSEDFYKLRRTIFGENVINIRDKSNSQLLLDEVLHPFYVFQVFSIVLWLLDDYYYYAFCIFMISIVSIVQTLIETRQTMKRLKDISRFTCSVRVCRNEFWKEVSSEDLVPGDIFEVSDPSISLLPCDSILLSGDCIVNESMLTGESVPVSKVALTQNVASDLEFEFSRPKFSQTLAKSFLYSGTKVIRSRKASADEASIALVVKTGFNTTKGALVRSMLFPKPTGFKFYEDSFRYIGVMTIIAAIGFIFSTINFIKLGLGPKIIILRALDLITIVVPPALPATLTIGTSFALSRLRQKQIFCISPTRVNVGGKLDVMCFDKTGTLTEDGLDVLGIHMPVPLPDRKSSVFCPIISSNLELLKTASFELLGESLEALSHEKAAGNRAINLFASMLNCHSLKSVDGELIGDPLDNKMFEFTNWIMTEDERNEQLLEFYSHYDVPDGLTPSLISPESSHNDHFILIKEFEFVSHLRRMAVITQAVGSSNALMAYVKGAPEVIEKICNPETLPEDYEELLHHYTHNGFRVIACAGKTLNASPSRNDLRFVKDLKREDCETELEFLGFIVFENKLKPSTKASLKQLSDANLRCIMCTGDNVLTAISVARECCLVDPESAVYLPVFVDGPNDEGSPFVWEEVDNPDLQLDPVTLEPLSPDQSSHFCLAVTGDVFKYILTELKDQDMLIEKMLMKGNIFTRMSPDEKHELVEQLKKLDYTVGFCGDGANDCGALKAADVGISLSEAEASVAAPFTSRLFEISCVLDVIKEGRASLVTSFSCFQFMSLYSAIQFVSVSILYKRGTNLGDFQFLYIDMFLILPIAIFMSWSKPFPILCQKRPTANLISPKILIPLMGDIAILLIFQVIVWNICQDTDWYLKPIPGNDDAVKSTDNTALFAFANFQYILAAIVLTVGPPYREPATKNVPFIVNIVCAFLISALLLLIPQESSLGDLMDLTYTSWSFKLILVAMAAVNYAVLQFGHTVWFVALSKLYKKFFGRKTSKKAFKRLKMELEHSGHV